MSDTTSPAGGIDLADVVNSLNAAVDTKQINVVLHWSELVNGQWSPARSGAGPTSTCSLAVPLKFDPSNTFIRVVDRGVEHLDIEVRWSTGEVVNFRVPGRNGSPRASMSNTPPRDVLFEGLTRASTRYVTAIARPLGAKSGAALFQAAAQSSILAGNSDDEAFPAVYQDDAHLLLIRPAHEIHAVPGSASWSSFTDHWTSLPTTTAPTPQSSRSVYVPTSDASLTAFTPVAYTDSTGLGVVEFQGTTYAATGPVAQASPSPTTHLVAARDAQVSIGGHTHPYASELMRRLTAGTIRDLESADTETKPAVAGGPAEPALRREFFSSYGPTSAVYPPYPVDELDFERSGAYSIYNWELFFHIPLSVAIGLSKNGRFAEAQQWFHHVFDPTDSSDEPSPQRYWKFQPFKSTPSQSLDARIRGLSENPNSANSRAFAGDIRRWAANPFNPHLVARARPGAHKTKTVMAYLDNLIAWGDSLFRQDQPEAIDEALMLYSLAAEILGPRPQAVPNVAAPASKSYADLRDQWNAFGDALRDVELELPFASLGAGSGTPPAGQATTLSGIAHVLYFGVPSNRKVHSYWDTVEDRLFKIHNSRNFDGVFRHVAQFAPQIDLDLVLRAAAAGVDVAAVISGTGEPLPLVRATPLLQLAFQITQEVKALGSALLAAIEREDGEAMAILRAQQERAVLGIAEHVKYSQFQEAIKSREALVASFVATRARYVYYERQLGRSDADIARSIPTIDDLDVAGLTALHFDSTEPTISHRQVTLDLATSPADAASATAAGKLLSVNEVLEARFTEQAHLTTTQANAMSLAASIAHLIPNLDADGKPLGVGAGLTFGGVNIGGALDAAAMAFRAVAETQQFQAQQASRLDSFIRREREWTFQSNAAAAELNQIYKQLRAAQLRERIADIELEQHRVQMRQANDIVGFLNGDGADPRGKTSNRAFYSWLRSETKALYGSSFRLAFDVARRAELALRRELGNPKLSILQNTYMGGNEGLLAAERLLLDLERLEVARQQMNAREYELTKDISLLQVNPLALVDLRQTGSCKVSFGEALFDLDGPGHYFRRIKSVAVSMPCVVGPYASVNCTLSQTMGRIRVDSRLTDPAQYPRKGDGDTRFEDYLATTTAVVTSKGVGDSGMFETRLDDERYLPFEFSGVIGDWELRLPGNPRAGDPCTFDYSTIADVIVHIRYTARDARSDTFRKAAVAEVRAQAAAGGQGNSRLFSVRNEFPTAWAQFVSSPPVNGLHRLALTLRPEHYPFWAQGNLGHVATLTFLAVPTVATLASLDLHATADLAAATKVTATGVPLRYDVTAGSALKPPQSPLGDVEWFLSDNHLADLWIVVTWQS